MREGQTPYSPALSSKPNSFHNPLKPVAAGQPKYGTIMYRQNLSPILEIVRVVPLEGERFPSYRAGQYISLTRENCRLTRKIADKHGKFRYVADVDESGNRRRGTVTRSYSIASAPFETERSGYLEFYIVLESVDLGESGRLYESLFHFDDETDNRLQYSEDMAGDFTLEHRAAGFENVVFICSGTGLAPFVSMIKHLHHAALPDLQLQPRYTLFYTNRTREELAYHDELLAIDAAQKFDFVYVPTVSRPTRNDVSDPNIGRGRGNNLLRSLFGMLMKEEEDYWNILSRGGNISHAKDLFEKAVTPVLPTRRSRTTLLERMVPSKTVILSCGNHDFMSDIKKVAERNSFRFEMEEW